MPLPNAAFMDPGGSGTTDMSTPGGMPYGTLPDMSGTKGVAKAVAPASAAKPAGTVGTNPGFTSPSGPPGPMQMQKEGVQTGNTTPGAMPGTVPTSPILNVDQLLGNPGTTPSMPAGGPFGGTPQPKVGDALNPSAFGMYLMGLLGQQAGKGIMPYWGTQF